MFDLYASVQRNVTNWNKISCRVAKDKEEFQTSGSTDNQSHIRQILFQHNSTFRRHAMMHMNKLGSLLGLAAALTLGACGSMNNPGTTSSSSTAYPPSSNSSRSYSSYGVVQSIDLVRQDTAPATVPRPILLSAVSCLTRSMDCTTP